MSSPPGDGVVAVAITVVEVERPSPSRFTAKSKLSYVQSNSSTTLDARSFGPELPIIVSWAPRRSVTSVHATA